MSLSFGQIAPQERTPTTVQLGHQEWVFSQGVCDRFPSHVQRLAGDHVE